jgi:hypothetical protein
VVTDRVEEPEPPEIVDGEKVAVAPAGNPLLTLKVTLLLKPPDGVTLTV